jgi:hypothetical protein
MKATFSSEVIEDLRKRVISHNKEIRAIAANESAALVKLSGLKGLYKRWYGGKEPHQHALELIDRHLAESRATLAKARPPFNPGEHPRDERGEFTGHQVRQVGLVNRSVIDQSQGEGANDPALLEAAQTQVIPETRYSVYGPPIAGAAALGFYGLTGATATTKPTLIDRPIIAGLRAGGERIGGFAGKLSGHAIHGAAQGARAGIGAINRNLHTSIRRPSASAGAGLAARLTTAGARAGRVAGTAAGRGQSIAFQAPGFIARKGVEAALGSGRVGRVTGRAAGALASMYVLGHVLGGTDSAMQVATTLGPYLDAAFPRRVRKIAGPLYDAPEVLAKVQALVGDDELAKASIGQGLRLLSAAGRNIGARAARFVRTVTPSIASHSTGPRAAAASAATPSIGGAAAAERIYGAARHGFAVRPRRAGRALEVSSHIAPLGIFGAGTGALAGAGGVAVHDRFFEAKHPRDKQGRFATKASAAGFGAKVGAAVGAGLGLTAGLIAARGGHAALLRAAAQRLGAEASNLHAATETEARNVHAREFFADKRNRAAMGDFRLPPGSPEPTHAQVKEALEAQARKAWDQTVGAALKGGPVSYYTHQVDMAFDRTAFDQLRRVANRQPLVDKTGARITRSSQNLVHNLDPEQLSPAQRTLWDDLVRRRQEALDNVQQVYTARRARTAEIETNAKALDTEKQQLQRDLSYVPDRAQELDHERASYATIANFAKTRLGHDLKTPAPPADATMRDLQGFARQHFNRALTARTKTEAVEEVHELASSAALDEVKDAIPAWEARVNGRLDAIDRESTAATQEIQARRGLGASDLTDAERMAIRNPFATGRRQFFEPMPDTTVARAAVANAASRDFMRQSDLHATAGREHLNHLMAAQQAVLEAGVRSGPLATRFAQHWPQLAGRARAMMEDWAQIRTAHRNSLPPGTMKAVYDFVHANRNPAGAYATAAKLSADAGSKGRRAYHWAVRNAGLLSTITGLAGAVGAYDIAAPKGRRWRANPFEWSRPKGLRIERERPNPIERPHEIALGISYTDRDNQQKYLTGLYVHGKGEKDYSHIPYGVSVEQVRGQIRGRGGQPQGQGHQHQAQRVEVPDARGLNQTVERLRRDNHIGRVGPAGAQFQARTGGDPGPHAKAVAEGLYKQHIEYLERIPAAEGESTNRAERYWTSLKSLFEAPGTEVLTPAERTALLVGGGPQNFKRGIFGNKDGVLSQRGGDATAQARELIRQIKAHTPTGPDEYRQLNRAVHLVAERVNLPQAQRDQVNSALQQAYTRSTAQQPPRGAESEAAGSLQRAQQVAEEALKIPRDDRGSDSYRDDDEFRRAAVGAYQARVRHYRQVHGHGSADPWNEQRMHDEAASDTLEMLRKSEDAGGLRKYLVYPPGTRPRQPRIPGVPKTPSIDGAATAAQAIPQGPATPRTPRIGAAAKQPNFATRIGAAHQLGQAGNYGVATGLYEGADLLAGAIPGGGALTGAARTLIPAAGSLAGVMAAAPALRGVGQRLGDKGTVGDPRSESENYARMGAGLVGSIAGQKIGRAAAKVGLRAAPRAVAGDIAGSAAKAVSKVPGVSQAGSAIAGAARRLAPGLFQRLGGTIGGQIGGVGGAIAGEAVEPAGGGIFGAWRGHALGAALGAGAGYLADEGVGFLYRHLGSYGAHVPHLAAKTLGVPPEIRARHAKGLTTVAAGRNTRPAQPQAAR